MKTTITMPNRKEITCTGKSVDTKVLYEIGGSVVYAKVIAMLKNVRLTSDRQARLNYEDFKIVTSVACGTGGVGSIRIRRNGDVYFQYTCGRGRNNYADCVVIGHIRKDNGFFTDKFVPAI